jgi:hypothetical protein
MVRDKKAADSWSSVKPAAQHRVFHGLGREPAFERLELKVAKSSGLDIPAALKTHG